MKTPEEIDRLELLAASYACDYRDNPRSNVPPDSHLVYSVAYDAFLAGYETAKDEMNSLEKPDSCEHILDMEKMVDVNPSSSWISVKDHYPWPSNDDCDPKLVAIKAANGYVFDVADTAGSCRWRDKLDENIEHEGHEVTHWMELPAPPKEEG